MTSVVWSCPSSLALSALLTACLDPTPFGAESEVHDLNARNVARLMTSEAPHPLRFVALGDSHDAYDELLSTVECINARRDVDFIVHVGDQSNFGLLQEFEWTQRALARLERPVIVALGNHDAISSGKDVYESMYGTSDFAFFRGDQKFIVFNSNSLEFPGVAPDRAWLSEQLSDLRAARSAVLITHQDPRAPDEPADTAGADFYRDLITTSRVALIIHGHVERLSFDAWGKTPTLACGTFQKTRGYLVVTLGPVPSVEHCRFQDCAPLALAERPVGDR